jgi:RNA polymerase sigma factor (sigma-70 family)
MGETVKPGAHDLNELLQGAITGDEHAWKDLIKRLSGLVQCIAREHRLSLADTADVSQIVWMRMYENAERIRDPQRLTAWVAVVARHECARTLRKSSNEILVGEENALDLPADDREVDHQMMVRERNAMLWRAVSELPAHNGSLIRLLVTDPSPSYERAARELGMPIGSIGPTRQRSLRVLRANATVRTCQEMALS